MTGWVIRIIAAASFIGSQAQGVVNYVNTLPPRPEQSTVECRDNNWEQTNLLTVGGSKVHKKLAPFVEQLLSTAHSQGVGLNITVAYRSCAHQLSLRQANCGLGEYNLYQKPSNLCTPPTEPAGKSLHNEGLALDFNCQGYGRIEASPCLKWLQQNAGRYHLFVHPLEQWHWSTTGK